MKRFLVTLMLIIVGGVVFFGWKYYMKQSTIANQGWSLSEVGAIYIIHGAQDYDTGPGYYLYKTHEGKTMVARIDPKSPANLTHFTDRPVRLDGTVSFDAAGVATIRVTSVERAD